MYSYIKATTSLVWVVITSQREFLEIFRQFWEISNAGLSRTFSKMPSIVPPLYL